MLTVVLKEAGAGCIMGKCCKCITHPWDYAIDSWSSFNLAACNSKLVSYRGNIYLTRHATHAHGQLMQLVLQEFDAPPAACRCLLHAGALLGLVILAFSYVWSGISVEVGAVVAISLPVSADDVDRSRHLLGCYSTFSATKQLVMIAPVSVAQARVHVNDQLCCRPCLHSLCLSGPMAWAHS